MITLAQGFCTAQQTLWFEGMAEYTTTMTMRGISAGSSIYSAEYYKDGNVLTHAEMGTTLYRSDTKAEMSKEIGQNKIETTLVADMPTLKATVDKKPVTVEGHECIRVTHIAKASDPAMGSAEMTTTDYIDVSFVIPYQHGRISEVPTGLVVKSESTIETDDISFSYTKRLKNLLPKQLEDSLFKL